NTSQIERPFPSSRAAPSIWYAAVAAPHWKPLGNSRNAMRASYQAPMLAADDRRSGALRRAGGGAARAGRGRGAAHARVVECAAPDLRGRARGGVARVLGGPSDWLVARAGRGRLRGARAAARDGAARAAPRHARRGVLRARARAAGARGCAL